MRADAERIPDPRPDPMTRPTSGRLGATVSGGAFGVEQGECPIRFFFSISRRPAGVEVQERGEQERSGEASRRAAPLGLRTGREVAPQGKGRQQTPGPKCADNRTRIPSGVNGRVVRGNGFAGSSGPSGRRVGERA